MFYNVCRGDKIMPTNGEYMKKVNHYYDENDLLMQYPSKRPMREIVLAKIAETFEEETDYTEKEVNAIIKEHIAFSDIELIRRELFQYKILGRLKDGSKYWLKRLLQTKNCIRCVDRQVTLSLMQYMIWKNLFVAIFFKIIKDCYNTKLV